MHPNTGIEELKRLIENEMKLAGQAFPISNLDEEEVYLEPLMFNLFNKIKFNLFSIELTSPPDLDFDLKDIVSLTSTLYDILKDKTVGGTGRFNANDEGQVRTGNFWVGKLWVDYKTSSLVMLKMEGGSFSLLIIDRSSC